MSMPWPPASSLLTSDEELKTNLNCPPLGWTQKQNDDWFAAWGIQAERIGRLRGQKQRNGGPGGQGQRNGGPGGQGQRNGGPGGQGQRNCGPVGQGQRNSSNGGQDHGTNYHQPPPGWTHTQNFRLFGHLEKAELDMVHGVQCIQVLPGTHNGTLETGLDCPNSFPALDPILNSNFYNFVFNLMY